MLRPGSGWVGQPADQDVEAAAGVEVGGLAVAGVDLEFFHPLAHEPGILDELAGPIGMAFHIMIGQHSDGLDGAGGPLDRGRVVAVREADAPELAVRVARAGTVLGIFPDPLSGTFTKVTVEPFGPHHDRPRGLVVHREDRIRHELLFLTPLAYVWL